MAQTTRSSSTRSKRSGSSTSRSTSRNGRSTTKNGSRSNASSKTRRAGSNGSRAKTSQRKTSPSRSRSRSRSSTNGPIAQAGEKVGNVAGKAKGPLLAVGAAVAGVAGGVALKSRNQSQSRNPLSKLGSPSLPKAVKKIDLSKIDLDKITSAANTVRSIGEQVGDVADAAEKTRKKHK